MGAPVDFVTSAARNLFFTGKGGVGKTSLACMTAVALADRGKRVLLVSTDPASNLDEVLGVTLGNKPTPIPDVAGLFALNLDPEESAREYRDRVVGPYRGILPETVVASMEEQLSGSCTVEIAAFDEFSRLLGDRKTTAEFDHVVFDTAPTGHTLRLLSLPAAWTGFIDKNTTGTSCLGPLAGLQEQHRLYQGTVEALSDAKRTTLILVTRAEVMANAGAGLDAQGRDLLEEDLRSPCTEEIAVFRAFARAVDQGKDGFVVLDTAPTGHTILLLDAALAYHRELSRQSSEIPESVRQLLPRLRDPKFTRILLVTLPEATPVHEAAKLQEDLLRAKIGTFAWVINQSLAPLAVTDPLLLARQRHEGAHISEVVHQLASRTAIIPWLVESPLGAEKLLVAVRGERAGRSSW
jgi:anion-transporting  ArsA/GET3 family ATPase